MFYEKKKNTFLLSKNIIPYNILSMYTSISNMSVLKKDFWKCRLERKPI